MSLLFTEGGSLAIMPSLTMLAQEGAALEKGLLAGSKDVGKISPLLTAWPANPAEEGEVERRGENRSCPTPSFDQCAIYPATGRWGARRGERRQVALTVQAAGDQSY
jgi:hypothetical protein